MKTNIKDAAIGTYECVDLTLSADKWENVELHIAKVVEDETKPSGKDVLNFTIKCPRIWDTLNAFKGGDFCPVWKEKAANHVVELCFGKDALESIVKTKQALNKVLTLGKAYQGKGMAINWIDGIIDLRRALARAEASWDGDTELAKRLYDSTYYILNSFTKGEHLTMEEMTPEEREAHLAGIERIKEAGKKFREKKKAENEAEKAAAVAEVESINGNMEE